ncbi:MAG: Hsp20 family protein, partial [Nitrospinaceae bacterium]|nr:Hsp20 family protein [Nitrospinaceae bacterium]
KEGATEARRVGGPVYIPAVDIYEKEDAVLLRCDMPGVSDQDLDITVEDGVLTLEGVQEVRVPEG